MKKFFKKNISNLILILLIFVFASCSSYKSIKLVNMSTEETKTIKVDIQGELYINDLPKIIGNYYVKGYSYKKNGAYIDVDDKIELKNDGKLYYREGIRKDYFNIDSVGYVFIDCDEEINSRTEYVDAKIRVVGDGEDLSANAQIRLRGNTTFHLPKKPYKIKFNSKQNLFNMGSDKEWALLANYFDPTYMRNFYAYTFSKAIGMEYTCDAKFVEVYLNDEYNGLYLLTETVKTSKERVNIEVNDYSKGVPFLLELDMKLVQDDKNYEKKIDKELFLVDNKAYNNKTYPIGTKYPKTFEELNDREYEYIKNYIFSTFESVRNGTFEQFLDIENFIDYFLVQELFMNIDLDYSSVFLYKDIDSKLKFGPIWDFDLSSGNVGYVKKYSFDKSMADVNGGNYLFTQAMKYDSFHEQFMERFLDLNRDVIPAMIDSIEYNYAFLSDYAFKDNEKWGVLYEDNWARPDNLVGISYLEQVEYFENFMIMHNQWMIENM